VIDANGDTCGGQNSFVIIQSPPPTVTVTTVNATCLSCNDGSASVTVTGGTAPYNYQWSNGSTAQSISTLSPGTYSVMVVDANGCLTEVFFTIGIGNNGFYTIEGDVYFDVNSNGVRDSGETGLPNQQVMMQPPGSVFVTDPDGHYLAIVIDGTYDMSYQPSTGWNLTSLPAVYNANVNGSSVTGLDFGIFPDSTAGSANLGLYSGNPRCLTNVLYYPQVYNNGFTILNGTLTFNFDASQTFVSSDIPPVTAVGTTVVYNFSNLLQGQTFMPHITLLEPVAGTVLNTSAILAASDVFGNIINDTIALSQVVSCSYDPNDKSVQPAGIGTLNYVPMDSWLSYQIRFQNTGNDTAYNVVVIDTLDMNLDVATFAVLASSHPVVTSISPDRVVTFTYDNIYLPDSIVNEPQSHGYIIYHVKGISTMADPTTVNNTAYIYFDLNAPVLTNTTLTTFSDNFLSVAESENDDAVIVYPNPVHSNLVIHFEKDNPQPYRAILLDVTGREVLQTGMIDQNDLQLNVNGLSAGTYILKIASDSIVYRRITIQ
jgi:uncharacterized repeat protein (TIGR01451 family)